MCEVAERLENKGIAKGIEKGIEKGEAHIIQRMYHNGFTAEQIAAATDKKLEEVKIIIADNALSGK